MGRTRAAVVQLGNMLEFGVLPIDAMDADSQTLEALHAVYFHGNDLRDEFVQGGGTDLLDIDGVI